ncbi:MAG: hypothetical protein K1Y02_15835, partial [Candidatus Hydrogenedentes bacterium]|nr:hypothetical protein [Candidatus Hydrogenedentota bacterium]
MSQIDNHDERTRMLREFLLGTSSPEETEVVRRNLAESSEWQEALVREQHALALLDVLEPEAPSRDLSAAIL